MNINQIKYFVSVFEQQSFSLAAQEQCISVQAVSKAIGDLERDFGDKLFNRSNRGATPTPLGTEFYRKARPVLESFRELEAFAAGTTTEPEEPLGYRVGLCAPNSVSARNMCQTFSAFVARNTGLMMEVDMMTPDEAISKLRAGSINAVITIGKLNKPGIRCTTLGSLPSGITVAKSHPLAAKQSVSIAELSEYPAGASPVFDEFNQSILVTYRDRGLISNIKTIDSLAENDWSFMGSENGYFFSVVFPLSNTSESPLALVPIAAGEQLSIPICANTLSGRVDSRWRMVEDFITKTVGETLRRA